MKKARRQRTEPRITIHDAKEVSAFRRFLKLRAQKVGPVSAYKAVYGKKP